MIDQKFSASNDFVSESSLRQGKEQMGKALEKECLEEVNARAYVNEVTEYLRDEFWKKKLGNDYRQKRRRLLTGLSDVYNSIKTEAEDYAKGIVDSRVRKDRHRAILTEDELYTVIERSQPFNNPAHPNIQFAKDLQATISKKVEAQKLPVDYKNIEYYTAVNSNLDAFGIDAFLKFKYTDKAGKSQICRVAFDLTADTVEGKNQKIQEKIAAGGRYLADTILYLTGQEDYVSSRDQGKTEEFSNQVISILKNKINQVNKLIKEVE
jgi:hypothetical protein